MTTLRTISLSNIRRFGADVSIPVSAGATILLAPNGTGKTAIFEAIELALTGRVARLRDDLFPLIRDNTQSASVRLQFEGFAQEAHVRRPNTQASQWAWSKELFGGVNVEDLTYLLRLTHLLDQRDRDWFVQATEDEAGAQLTKLPMGKDAQQAARVMQGLKSSLTRTMTERTRDVEDAQSRLSRWENLLARRNSFSAPDGHGLPTLADVGRELRDIVNSDGDLNWDTLERIESQFSVAMSDNVSAREDSVKFEAKLQGVAGVPAEFGSHVKDAEAHQRASRVAEDERKAEEVKRSDLLKIVDDLNNRRAQKSQARDEFLRIREKIAAATTAKAQLQLHTESLQACSELLEKSAKEVEVARVALANIRDTERQHRTFEGKRRSVDENHAELEAAKQALRRWSEDDVRLAEIDKRLEAADIQLGEIRAQSEAVTTERNEAAERVKETGTILEQLQKSTSAIKVALSSIVAHLESTAESCPLCGVHHGAEDLRKRIDGQLEEINPALTAAADRNRSARERLAASDAQLTALGSKVKATQAARNDLARERSELGARVVTYKQHPLMYDMARAEAGVALEQRQSALTQLRSELDRDVLAAPAKPAAGDISDCEVRFDQAEATRSRVAQDLVRHREAKALSRTRLGELEAELPDPVIIQSISENILGAERDVLALDDERQKADAQVAKLNESMQKIRAREQESLLKYRTSTEAAAQLREKWSGVPLSGEPSSSTLQQALADIASKKLVLENKAVRLNAIRQDLAKLQGAAALQLAQKDVDAERGELAEPEFETTLVQKVARANEALTYVGDRRKTVDTLSNLLSQNILEMREHITAVVPVWQSLLRKIVREPRFAETVLTLQRQTSRTEAHVQVQLSGQPVLASEVASEAQKTDLQLTFLLSMALVHSWCPWKALLLDDPTQHHDLVHAASVFDVLRDYIVDHGFQVIVTTHDAVQARFFARKLMNDGIDVNLVSLVPGADGVVAKSLLERSATTY